MTEAAPGQFALVADADTTFVASVSGAGHPVLLLHGLAGSRRWWRETIPALESHFQVIAVDLPGFGSNRGRSSLAGMVGQLADAMEVSGRGPFHLIGHSLGGLIAVRLTSEYPHLVDRLVLVDAALLHFRPSLTGHVTHVAQTVPQTRWRELKLLARDAARSNPIAMMRVTRELLRANWGAALTAIESETLVVWGALDRLVPLSTGRLIAAAIPGARLEVIASAGHNPMLQESEQFNQIVLDFLDPH